MRLRHSRSFNKDVVEHLLLGQSNDLLYKIVLQSAANTSILHPNHILVTLDQGGLINQTLVNVKLGHVIDDDSSPEGLVLMFILEDVLEQGGLTRAKEPAEKSHWNLVRDNHFGLET